MSNQAVINNTNLSNEELEHFKQLLLEEKASAEKEISILKKSIRQIENKMDDTNSSAAHHQGNLGSSEELRETNYTLIEKQKDKLDKIAVALDRIETGNYGVCVVTGEQIQKERLEAIPYTVHAFETTQGNLVAASKEQLAVRQTV
ncbi:MAG: hypothetical protein JJ895_06345 [Balneolaceae bacterium]|nr:hypothetical protein [Balneolaceae bacterium]